MLKSGFNRPAVPIKSGNFSMCAVVNHFSGLFFTLTVEISLPLKRVNCLFPPLWATTGWRRFSMYVGFLKLCNSTYPSLASLSVCSSYRINAAVSCIPSLIVDFKCKPLLSDHWLTASDLFLDKSSSEIYNTSDFSMGFLLFSFVVKLLYTSNCL